MSSDAVKREAMVIREETAAEFGRIHTLVETAFQTARVTNGDEQDFVERLRATEGNIPELALVAQEGSELVGHIMLTRLTLTTDDGRLVRSLLLAPLAVRLERRSRGIGAALVREALRRAGVMGYQAVFLVGDPAYYGRLGFTAASEFSVSCSEKIPPQYVLALELVPGALTTGTVEMEKI